MLKRVQAIKQEAKLALGRAAASMPVSASALVAFAGMVGIADFFTGSVVVSTAAGVLAGNTTTDVMLKQDARKQR